KYRYHHEKYSGNYKQSPISKSSRIEKQFHQGSKSDNTGITDTIETMEEYKRTFVIVFHI
ncbi:MAG: hypothetical protein KAR21_04845, partial [Spirochaetales bacterium]|nr:hypothetical protein [Spirochaetales bacterium]